MADESELAWAAGLVAERGKVQLNSGSWRVVVKAQVDDPPEILERLRSAVGAGTVYREYTGKDNRRVPPQWQTTSAVDVLALESALGGRLPAATRSALEPAVEWARGQASG